MNKVHVHSNLETTYLEDIILIKRWTTARLHQLTHKDHQEISVGPPAILDTSQHSVTHITTYVRTKNHRTVIREYGCFHIFSISRSNVRTISYVNIALRRKRVYPAVKTQPIHLGIRGHSFLRLYCMKQLNNVRVLQRKFSKAYMSPTIWRASCDVVTRVDISRASDGVCAGAVIHTSARCFFLVDDLRRAVQAMSRGQTRLLYLKQVISKQNTC